jgi:phosphate transport system protein
MTEHIRKNFDEELATVRVRVHAMGERCLESLRVALGALRGSSAVARCEEIDRHIDDDEIQIDALVFQTFALQQPVAQDLRTLAATFKLTTDLERIGDEACAIAHSASDARGDALEIVREDLEQMSAGAESMLEDAVLSFLEQDVNLAESVGPRDDTIDRTYAHVLKRIAEHLQSNPIDAFAAVRILEVSRNLERIADHATNIAEETIFAARGSDTRHLRPSHTG